MGHRIGLINRIQLDENTGCWNWRGGKTKYGYGVVRYLGEQQGAHRVSAHLWLGLDLQDRKKLVMHVCDNPSCFNPKHLRVATPSENLIDCVRKGRNWQTMKTHCKVGHPLVDGNIYRTNTRVGHGRRCKICALEYVKVWRARQRSIEETT